MTKLVSSLTPSFNEIAQSKLCSYQHREINQESLFLTLLKADSVNEFTKRSLSYHDLLFNDDNQSPFISCGLKYGLQPGERPDLINFPITFNSDWRVYSLDGQDEIYVVSKYNGEIIIRRQNHFPLDNCNLNLLSLSIATPKFYDYISNKKFKTGHMSCIFIKRGSKILLLTLMRHLDAQPQPQEMVDIWAKDMGLERPIPVKNPTPALMLELSYNYNLKKILFHKEDILQISNPWFSRLQSNKNWLNRIDVLTDLWINHEEKDFLLFSDRTKHFHVDKNCLAYIYSANTRINKLHGYLKLKLNSFSSNEERYRFANSLPKYLQSLCFHLINNKGSKFDKDRSKKLYTDIVSINMGSKPS